MKDKEKENKKRASNTANPNSLLVLADSVNSGIL